MSYDFTADHPPVQSSPDGQQLADWAHLMFQRVENNLLNQRGGWNIFPMNVINENASGISPPSVEKVTDDGSGSTGVYAYTFARNRTESLHLIGQTTLSLTPGMPVLLRIRWAPTNSGSGNVVWGIEVVVTSLGEVIGNTQILRAVAPTNTTSHQFLAVQIDPQINVPHGELQGLSVLARIFRDHSNPNDNYSSNALYLGAQAYVHVADLGGTLKVPSSLTSGQTIIAHE